RELVANDPSLSGAQIRRKLVEANFKDARVPSDRAIRRIVTEFPPEERQPYKFFSWPTSMESGALPWEASRACLDLLRYLNEQGRKPPLNSLAQAFWYITLAAPAAPIKERVEAALS